MPDTNDNKMQKEKERVKDRLLFFSEDADASVGFHICNRNAVSGVVAPLFVSILFDLGVLFHQSNLGGRGVLDELAGVVVNFPLDFAGNFYHIAEALAVSLFEHDDLFPFGFQRTDTPFAVVFEEYIVGVEVVVLIRAQRCILAVLQEVLVDGILEDEVVRRVDDLVIRLSGHRFADGVEQIPLNGVVVLFAADLSDQVAVLGFGLDVHRVGEGGFGVGDFDADEGRVFSRVGDEVGRSFDGRLYGFELVAAHSQQADETCENDLFHFSMSLRGE